ncbi:leucyl aminopeptidase [Amphritea balenae]|uniref:Probable cytosol aminopeptidase n=1 Tax=Amphritea balenae TaxID=452629 RepID=A0A3P1SRQ3_9GAMM|nr:leucyl aminopeptidase [Amphritea balenae]RRC99729.1 leucyl aminopeptidase [Amphritea balenae]GGK79367.1 cytosol aminopeptidase [Amphritea balenae]
MEFEIVTGSVESLETDCLIVGVAPEGNLSPSADLINKASAGYLKDVVGDHQGKAGEALLLHKVPGISAGRVLLVGIGKADEHSDRNQKKIIKAVMANLKAIRCKSAVLALDGQESADQDLYRQLRHNTEWASAELYQYDATKSKKAEPIDLQSLGFLLSSEDAELGEFSISDGSAIANGVDTARELGNLPGNICTPSYLAEQAQALTEECDELSTTILNEDEMEKLGMHSLLSVGKGSSEPSKLIVMEFKGGEPDQKPHVLVGKGITFDTGGISLKPGAKMDEMKYDMCGAASVMGTMEALTELDLEINVVAIIAAAENMPAGNASKPGDIVTTMSGQTVEILNTDAEGRLVLCDALTYAERFEPETVVDIATLTGACIVALGHQATGLLSNDDLLADDLLAAGEFAADKAWRLPLWDEYQEQLDSNFADIANIGGPAAGTVTAACFLSRFTKKYRWAHLDIAGVAWNSNGKAKGATGRCVPLLCQHLIAQVDDTAE